MLSSITSKRLVVGAAICVTALGIFAQQLNSWQRYAPDGSDLNVDLEHPDALIRSAHLARLPRDLLAQPLFKDLLDEDFVFYYEHNADRLGLVGALRRIAYEHELQWPDRLVAEVLDEPAEVALWRDDKGALRHFSLLLRRNPLEKVIEQAASVALKDKQLKLAGTLRVGSDSVNVLSLEYAPRRALLLASRGERLVILSAPGMLIDAQGAIKEAAAAAVSNWLAMDSSSAAFPRQARDTPPVRDGHQVLIGANTLSLGYQHFFPSFEAMRFDFGAQSFSTYVRLAAQQPGQDRPNGAPVWQALPAGAAACALLPVDWHEAGEQLRDDLSGPAGGPQQFDTLVAQADGAAAACWYREGRLATPLFVARLRSEPSAELAAQLGKVFMWSIPKAGGDVAQTRSKEVATWTREAQLAPRAKDDEGAKTKVAFALAKQYVLFSPDARLVERAIAAIELRYPNVHETLPQAARSNALATIHPKALAAMVKREAEQTLRDEPVLAQAITRQLSPRLDKFAKQPAVALVATPPSVAEAAWVPVEWIALQSR